MTTASERLTLALVRLAADGHRPPCGQYEGHKLWTSDDPGERAQAARWCQSCSVITECAAAADEQDERWHVWAGVDRGSDEFQRARREARKQSAA